MWNIIVCDSDEAEREQILEYIRSFSRENKWDAAPEGYAGWPELYEKLGQAEPDLLIIAQDGVEGLDIITNIHLPPRKFIWFSDLDFSLQAYRLCLSWFGSKPVTYQKIALALARCAKQRPEAKQPGADKNFSQGD